MISKDLLEKCDHLAETYLVAIEERKAFSAYPAVQYVEAGSGDILLVCEDGSLLYTPAELGKKINIKAFENGLRSDPEALKEENILRQWELALL